MSCLHYCCYCCCYCCDQCCPHRKEKPPKYPHIEYKSPKQAIQSVTTHHETEKVPLERRYEFQQPRAEIFQPHSLTPPVPAVTEQPRRHSGTPSPSASPLHRRFLGTPEHSDNNSDAGTVSSIQSAVDSHPTLQFSLYYDIQRRVLAVHIQQAYNLPIVMRGVSTFPCSPFVVLFLLPNKDQVFESKVVQRSLNPHFDQMFEFTGLLPEDIRKQTILTKVFHHGHSKNELIGIIALPLEEADLYGVSVKMKIDEKVEHFSQESKGQLLFSITYKPGIHALQGIILRAKNLQKSNGTATACPYVKVYLVHHGKRQHKWRSSVKRNTLMPIFNEAFRFDISSMDVKNVSLEVLLMDHNRFSGDEVLGIVRVGEHTPEETGQSHWNEVFHTPDHAISRWHSVWPITHIYDGSSDRDSVN